jgi:hypothetical protein
VRRVIFFLGISFSQVKTCAEYFLSSLKDEQGDGTRGEVLGRSGPATVH